MSEYSQIFKKVKDEALDPLLMQEITQKEYLDALDCLPPFRWGSHSPHVESFLFREFTCGPFTDQYAEVQICGEKKFFKRVVNADDRSTWITLQMVKNFLSYMAEPKILAYFVSTTEVRVYYREIQLTNGNTVLQFRDASNNWVTSLYRTYQLTEPKCGLIPCEAPND